MKRCPQCGRDYNDDSLSFCLDDGSELLFGPSSTDDPTTAILGATHESEAPTRQSLGSTPPPVSEERAIGPARSKKWLIAAPVVVVVLATAGYFGLRGFIASSAPLNSIAVLPFANTSGDKGTDFLSDGIAETLINNFTKIPELKVAARTTAFRFRGREGEPKEIGRELGVGSILTGSVSEQNDDVHVQVDLINTSDGSQIWGNRYDGKATDIVSIQQMIATDIASRLKLTADQTQRTAQTYTDNSDAYQHYLRGRYYWNKRNPESLKIALSEFEQAAKDDPNYPLAYVGIADCYVLLQEYADLPTAQAAAQAKANIDKALALDPDLAEAYASLGLIYQKLWQWKEAESAFEHSIRLNPNYPTAYHWYSMELRFIGQTDRSYQMIKKAAELDPMSLIIKSNLTVAERNHGEYDAALKECENMRSLDPNFFFVHECYGETYLLAGRSDEGIDELQKYVAVRPDGTAKAALGSALARTGRREEALHQVAELEKMFEQGSASASVVAEVYSALGDNDKAFEWIDKALTRGEGDLGDLNWDYQFESVRKDPRYPSVLARMGLR